MSFCVRFFEKGKPGLVWISTMGEEEGLRTCLVGLSVFVFDVFAIGLF